MGGSIAAVSVDGFHRHGGGGVGHFCEICARLSGGTIQAYVGNIMLKKVKSPPILFILFRDYVK